MEIRFNHQGHKGHEEDEWIGKRIPSYELEILCDLGVLGGSICLSVAIRSPRGLAMRTGTIDRVDQSMR